MVALAAVNAAWARARATAWTRGGESAPDHGANPDQPVIIDMDATPVTVHKGKDDRVGRRVRIRTDAASGTRDYLQWLHTRRDRRGTAEPLDMLVPLEHACLRYAAARNIADRRPSASRWPIRRCAVEARP